MLTKPPHVSCRQFGMSSTTAKQLMTTVFFLLCLEIKKIQSYYKKTKDIFLICSGLIIASLQWFNKLIDPRYYHGHSEKWARKTQATCGGSWAAAPAALACTPNFSFSGLYFFSRLAITKPFCSAQLRAHWVFRLSLKQTETVRG